MSFKFDFGCGILSYELERLDIRKEVTPIYSLGTTEFQIYRQIT